ncbi:MAG: hypothetical protein CMJ78_10920 [Planctomycetaceae bacterium]|nr:hypothetical protein [Planctomycetaceae bacterium]
MSLTIPDQWLAEAGITEQEARLELACRLYDSGQLTLAQGIRWPDVTRTAFEDALLDRGLPIHKLSTEDLAHDLKSLISLQEIQ